MIDHVFVLRVQYKRQKCGEVFIPRQGCAKTYVSTSFAVLENSQTARGVLIFFNSLLFSFKTCFFYFICCRRRHVVHFLMLFCHLISSYETQTNLFFCFFPTQSVLANILTIPSVRKLQNTN